jgi:Ni/Co efflux regulator RcnB
MKTILLVALALGAGSIAPVMAQQADYCDRSGYATGVTHPDDSVPSCDPRVVPRVQGVPQTQPAPTARQGYDPRTDPRYDARRDPRYDPRYDQRYDQRYDARRDPRYMGSYDARDGERWRNGDHYYGARGPEWRRGGHIPREYMARQYWVQDWRAHRLSPPPRGYQWVQVGGDYVLVALATGIIAQLLLSQQ